MDRCSKLKDQIDLNIKNFEKKKKIETRDECLSENLKKKLFNLNKKLILKKIRNEMIDQRIYYL